ncbi:MAG: amidohydrolase family protein [Chloroflexi bacterium]|nr:amidohydrolase family protein [Chloroflexota bacterium]
MAPIADGALLISSGRIARIGTTTELAAQFPNEPRLDGQQKLLMPGFINAHTRMSRILARGYRLPALDRVAAGGETLEFWRRYASALDYKAIRYSALLSAVEALRYGTTCVFDLLSAPGAVRYALDAVAEAVLQVGLRANIAYAVSDHEGSASGRVAVDENIRFAERARGEALLSASMGLDTCHFISDTALSYAVGAAAIARIGFHGIVGESLYAGRDCALSYGVSPTARLRRWGVLSKRTLLADAVYLSQQDRDLLRQSGAWLAHVPHANIITGVGLARILEYAAEGQAICLGTDGVAYDMLGEAQAALYAQMQATLPDREATLAFFAKVLTKTNAMMASTLTGERIGSLEVGALADLILIDMFGSWPDNVPELYRQLLLGNNGMRVDTVIVGGKVLYRQGKYQTVDVEQIVAHAREVTTILWQRLS